MKSSTSHCSREAQTCQARMIVNMALILAVVLYDIEMNHGNMIHDNNVPIEHNIIKNGRDGLICKYALYMFVVKLPFVYASFKLCEQPSS